MNPLFTTSNTVKMSTSKLLTYLLLLLTLVCCKKETLNSEALKKNISTSDTQSTTTNQDNTITIDTTFLISFNNKTLQEFYKSTYYKTVWQSDENRKTILDQLQKSDKEGLNPNDYNIKSLQDFEKKTASLDTIDKAKYDVLLTYNFQKYISDLTNGKLNPRELYKNWDLKRNTIEINETLTQLLKSDSISTKIEELKPSHIVYKRLKRALAIIETFPNDNLKKIKIDKRISINDTNSSLIDIKKRLIYWKDLKPKDSLSMIYDHETAEAVKKFQNRHGLTTDGIIDKKTIASLNFSKKQRKEQIIANLERWKWFPRIMGDEYVIINIPDYKLTLVSNQDTLKTHKVIVGRPKRKTPVLSSKLTQLVFNPTWTVPPTILSQDLIPDILKNRNYLTENYIKIYDSNKNIVSPNDWRLANAYNYRYVQTPGAFNSLGMVKFIFPNRFSVYLHDTNHRDFFEKIDRSLSSGCVRLENPLELTEYLLNDPINWNQEKITETLQTQQTKFIKIRKEVSIHLLYWTAWSENNKLIFRDDIYNLDADLYSKLRN